MINLAVQFVTEMLLRMPVRIAAAVGNEVTISYLKPFMMKTIFIPKLLGYQLKYETMKLSNLSDFFM